MVDMRESDKMKEYIGDKSKHTIYAHKTKTRDILH
jgi:hypothetical protein